MRPDFFKRAGLPQNPNEVADYLKARLNLSYNNFLIKQPEKKYAQIENDRWALSVDSAETLSPEETIALEKLKSSLASTYASY